LIIQVNSKYSLAVTVCDTQFWVLFITKKVTFC